MIRWRYLVEQYPCDLCMADPGEHCRSWSGTEKYEPHACRARLAAANDWREIA